MFHMMWALYPCISYIKVKEFITLWVPCDYCINACISMQWSSSNVSIWSLSLSLSLAWLVSPRGLIIVWNWLGELTVRVDTNMADFPPQSGSQFRNQKNFFFFPFSLCESLFTWMKFDIVLWLDRVGCTLSEIYCTGYSFLATFWLVLPCLFPKVSYSM